ncbi:MAG TPA: sulfate transporter [Mycobacterium sp.]
MARPVSQLAVVPGTVGTASLLTVKGVLDSSTYLKLRDAIIKAALDEPRAVLVDVNGLHVPTVSAWAVFTSARWHVSTWPDIPVVLICGQTRRRTAIAGTGVTRYVPVHASLETALATLSDNGRCARRRVRAEFPAALASLHLARAMVAETLNAWSHGALTPVATVIVNVFVENVLQHTTCAPVVVLESNGTWVSISVRDSSAAPAVHHEDPYRGGDPVSGLAIVASVCRAWGSMPTSAGKAVWAVIGPENRL